MTQILADADPQSAPTTIPPLPELISKARAMQIDLLAQGAATEANRRVSEAAMEALEKAGLTKITRPKHLGGYGYGPSALVRLGYELGQGCGSTAWCTNLANCNSWFASYWGIEAQNDIWKSNPQARLVDVVAPTGHCEIVEGGFMVWGKWPWASNCDNSQWATVAAIVPETPERAAGTAWFMMPIEQLSIDHGTWFVSGMQGTGSKTLVAEEKIFVPRHRMIYFDDIAAGTVPGCTIPGNDLAHFPFSAFGGASLAGPILGMAQGALNTFSSAMAAKLRVSMKPGPKQLAGENPFVQERIGRAQTMINAAFHLLTGTLEEIEEKIFAGEKVTVAQRVEVRGAIVGAVRLAVDATNSFMELAGASAADLDLPLQRFWRDINAASRHISFDAPGCFSMVGQHLLGLEPRGPH